MHTLVSATRILDRRRRGHDEQCSCAVINITRNPVQRNRKFRVWQRHEMGRDHEGDQGINSSYAE
jgi:hypothetical protein